MKILLQQSLSSQFASKNEDVKTLGNEKKSCPTAFTIVHKHLRSRVMKKQKTQLRGNLNGRTHYFQQKFAGKIPQLPLVDQLAKTNVQGH